MKLWRYRVGDEVVLSMPHDEERGPPQFEIVVELDGIACAAARSAVPEESS